MLRDGRDDSGCGDERVMVKGKTAWPEEVEEEIQVHGGWGTIASAAVAGDQSIAAGSSLTAVSEAAIVRAGLQLRVLLTQSSSRPDSMRLHPRRAEGRIPVAAGSWPSPTTRSIRPQTAAASAAAAPGKRQTRSGRAGTPCGDLRPGTVRTGRKETVTAPEHVSGTIQFTPCTHPNKVSRMRHCPSMT